MHLFRPFPCAPCWGRECGFKGKKRCQWGTRVPLKSFWSSNARWCSSRSKCHLQRYKAAGKEILKHTTMKRKSNGYVQQEYQIKKKKYPFTYRAPQKKRLHLECLEMEIVQNDLSIIYISIVQRWRHFPCSVLCFGVVVVVATKGEIMSFSAGNFNASSKMSLS